MILDINHYNCITGHSIWGNKINMCCVKLVNSATVSISDFDFRRKQRIPSCKISFSENIYFTLKNAGLSYLNN